MIKRWTPVLLMLLVCGVFAVFAVGCGDDDDDGDGAATSAETTESPTPSDDETTPADDGGETTEATGANAAAVEQCKKAYEATPNLSDEAKDKIAEVCEAAASGDAEAATQAAAEACQIVAEDTVPEGAARDAAISACEQIAAGALGEQ